MPYEDERWKVYPVHSGYKISNYGRVVGPRGHLLKLCPDKNGYYRLSVHVKPDQVTRLLHRIVCELFVGPPPFEGAQALHKDNVPANCHEDNLYWGGYQQNMDDREKAGRTSRGEKHSQAIFEARKKNAIRA